MKPYTIVVAYDGTDYHGWQEQKDQSTIAGVLQASFKKVFGHEIKTVGASRTDSGVHAMGQVARFYTDRAIDCKTMLRSWNGALPRDISIVSLEPTQEGFHPQHNVVEKYYYYYFVLERPLPFDARYVYYHSQKIDLKKMELCLQRFVGEHDFFAFSTGDCPKGTICKVDSISLEFKPEHNAYRITVRGKRFLHHMVRRIVGASLKIASRDDRFVDEITQALEKRKINHRFPTAPASGLLLCRIIYDN